MLSTFPPSPDLQRPNDVDELSEDFVNDVVRRYADPPFDCAVYKGVHPTTGQPHPIVEVPAGVTVPVRCQLDSPDGGRMARVDTFYVRRAEGQSRPAQGAIEWNALLELCIQNRMLPKPRKPAGRPSAPRLKSKRPPATSSIPFEDLERYRDDALKRLAALTRHELPEGHPAGLQHGRYIMSARILGEVKPLDTKALLDAIAGLQKFTRWPPLQVQQKPKLAPYPVGDHTLECWLARGQVQSVSHADFWRASNDGFMTLVRGYQEDGADFSANGLGLPPGEGFEMSLPVWRAAEFLLRARELGHRLALGHFKLEVIMEWEGLQGRRLISFARKHGLGTDFIARQATVRAEKSLTPADIASNLPAVAEGLVSPLLYSFSGYETSVAFFKNEIEKLIPRPLA